MIEMTVACLVNPQQENSVNSLAISRAELRSMLVNPINFMYLVICVYASH
jgi:hypothetical protein